MRGRKPKPTALKLLAGNPGRRPLPTAPEPPAFEGAPEPPDHLDEGAVAEWNRLAGTLAAMGVLTVADRACFAGYCQNYSRWTAAEAQLREGGMIVKSANGFPIQNPFLSVANGAMKHMQAFAVELGLTPSSRSRVNIQKPQAPSKFDKWLNRDNRSEA